MPKKTAEEKAAQTKELLDTLAESVESLTHEDEWRRYLQMGRLFRSYSFNNTMMILTQLPTATRVAGYKVWEKLGREVISGPGSSLKIFGLPREITKWVDAETIEDETAVLATSKDGKRVKVSRGYSRAPILSVFDISQTEGQPLPDVSREVAKGSEEERENARQIMTRVRNWLISEGWTVEREAASGTAKGWTDHDQRKISLDETMHVTDAARTLLHEAAHAILHGHDSPWVAIEQYGISQQHRGVAEVQADATAYVLADILGLDVSEASTGYVAGWATAAAGSTEAENLRVVIKTTGQAVHHAVTTLLDAVEEQDHLDAVFDEAKASVRAEAAEKAKAKIKDRRRASKSRARRTKHTQTAA